VRIQALGPEATVESFDERIIGGFARARKIQSDALRIGPKVHVARDELRALIDADRLRVADLRACALQRPHNILSPVAEARARRNIFLMGCSAMSRVPRPARCAPKRPSIRDRGYTLETLTDGDRFLWSTRRAFLKQGKALPRRVANIHVRRER